MISGIDMYSLIETYGSGSGCAGRHTWTLAPNPGGAPTVGNQGFSVSVAGASPPTATLALLGLQRSSFILNLPCPVQLLINPSISLFSPTTIPLPIPDHPSLSGQRIYVQTLHRNSGGIGSSPGLHLVIH